MPVLPLLEITGPSSAAESLPRQRRTSRRLHLDKEAGQGNVQVIMTICSLISLLKLGNPIAG
jgi:hypothetical protein